jgi:hypothetical protein
MKTEVSHGVLQHVNGFTAAGNVESVIASFEAEDVHNEDETPLDAVVKSDVMLLPFADHSHRQARLRNVRRDQES